MNTKLLRQQILDLAIRGKLVKQDPNDEPASVLLERIRAEKEQLIQQGKIKKTKASATTDTPHYQNTPFDIPNSWQWVKLGEIYNHNTGKALNSKDKEGRLMDYITTSNLYWNRFELEVIKQMPFADKDLERCVITKGDLLVCEGGDIGRAAIWNYDYDICIQNHIHRLRGKLQLCNLFYYYVFYEYKLTNRISSKGTTIQGLSSKEIDTLLIPLPPLAEQKRIVAEIEKWFALIDELDANKQDLQVAIRQVRAKVLDLAIHGKLVPQDPNDEPAIALLRRINPHYTPSDTSHYQNPPFDIPASWQWVRVSDIAKTITGGTPSKNKPQYYGGTFPFYKPADLDAGRNVIVASEYLSEEGKSISRVIPPNSIAICCIGSIGKCGYLAKECTTNQQINTIVPYTNIFPLLIYYYCCSSFFKQQLVDKSSAITISIVNKSKLEDTLIPLPPLAEQKRIVSEIERVFAVLDTIEESLR